MIQQGILTKQKGRAIFVALLFLFAAVFPVYPIAGWYCEGRLCGTTPGKCCCATPKAAEKDPRCIESLPAASHLDDVSFCAAQCGCKMVLRGCSNPTPAVLDTDNKTAFAPPFVTLLPVAHVSFSPTVIELQIRFLETRGPPPASFLAPALCLRARYPLGATLRCIDVFRGLFCETKDWNWRILFFPIRQVRFSKSVSPTAESEKEVPRNLNPSINIRSTPLKTTMQRKVAPSG